jgi:hypothetical protein
VIGAEGSPKIGEPIAVEMVPWVLPMSRLTVSEVDTESEAATPAIIAITMTPRIRNFLFIIQNSTSRLKKLIPNCEKIFV